VARAPRLAGPVAGLADSGAALLLVAWSLLTLGDSLNRGDWELSALILLLAGFAVVIAVAWRRMPLGVPRRQDLIVPVATCVLAAIAHPVAASMQLSGGRLVAVQAGAAAAAVSAAAGLALWPRGQRLALAATALLAVVTASLVFAFVPHPDIDVWAILQQSSTGLVHGADMYRQHWIDGFGLKAVYPYLPWSTVVVLPFHLVFGDVRVAMLVALLVAAWLLRRMAPAAPAALASLVLVAPHFPYYLVRSWTEPTLTVLLFAALLLIARGHPGWAAVALAVALASKQPIVLLLPVFAVWPSFGWRRTLASVGLAVALVAPWLIAGPRDFWHDAVSANLALRPIDRALSVPSGLHHVGIDLGFGLLLAVLIGVYALVWWRVPRSVSGLALACGLVVCGYDLANTQSFFNHYQLAASLLVAATALAGLGDRSPAG